jgi:hypothetical protein
VVSRATPLNQESKPFGQVQRCRTAENGSERENAGEESFEWDKAIEGLITTHASKFADVSRSVWPSLSARPNNFARFDHRPFFCLSSHPQRTYHYRFLSPLLVATYSSRFRRSAARMPICFYRFATGLVAKVRS